VFGPNNYGHHVPVVLVHMMDLKKAVFHIILATIFIGPDQAMAFLAPVGCEGPPA